MGEAKRRKQAGSYPNLDDPLEEVRRFWCGRQPGPAEDFVTPAGTLAITFDVQGVAPWTTIIDAGKIVEAVEMFQKTMVGVPYRPFIRSMGQELAKAKQNGDDQMLESSGIIGAWTVFYHPELGQKMREGVSTYLRRHGKAHITWHYSPIDGLAMALAERFVDLDKIAAEAPRDAVIGLVDPSQIDDPPGH
jgi:hypothetical protein